MRVRFGDRHRCAECGKRTHYYRVKARRSYACEYCGHQIYPTAGTPFERTRTPLRDWFLVMFMFCTSRNGVAAKEVERQLGVTYKTAWRMCHEIRAYMGSMDHGDTLGGPFKTVEADETYIGGVAHGKGTGSKASKTPVVAMVERGGNVIAKVAPNRKRVTLEANIFQHVRPRTEIHTDKFIGYSDIGDFKGYWHKTVNHSAGEYVRGHVSTTTVDGFWSQLKRGIGGTYIHVSAKHLPKYLAEFSYRWNMRREPHLMLDRLLFSFVR